jgi:VWFA-related protein
MPNFKSKFAGCFAIVTALTMGFLSSSCSAAAQDQSSDTTALESQTAAQLNIEGNLVVVRVVVRDARRVPVKGLKKESFKLFDQGKEQAIAQFDEELLGAADSNSTANNLPDHAAAAPGAAHPARFLALYFDNMNSSDGDLMRARDAADRYLAANLQPQDRVAIFNTEKNLSDFTSDPKQIHDALFKLQPGRRALKPDHECPNLSDYQAREILRDALGKRSDAWSVAWEEEKECLDFLQTNPGLMAKFIEPKIRSQAEEILGKVEAGVRFNMDGLEQVVNIVARMPGQRTVILVSPGFLSESEQDRIDTIIDRALRSQVIVSALDPRGVAVLLREADASNKYLPSGPAMGAIQRLDAAREAEATDVLSEFAQGTGGEYFHNNNDLKMGFGALAGHAENYVLAFTPTELKPDGKFHTLKVTLAEKQKGYSVQARRGYFAPKNLAKTAKTAPSDKIVTPEKAATQERAATLEKPAPPESAVRKPEPVREVSGSKQEAAQIPVEAQQTPSTVPPAAQGAIAEILLRLQHNYGDYLSFVPDIFADEHVIATTITSLPSLGDDTPDKPVLSKLATDSIFHLQRSSASGSTQLVESRDVRRVDRHTGETSRMFGGPAVFTGGFSYAPTFLLPQFKDCYGYKLLPNRRIDHVDAQVIEYVLNPRLPGAASCPLHEQIKGRAFIDPQSMQLMKIEEQRAHHALTKDFTVGWDWSIEYARVVIADKPFWLPKAINSTASYNAGRAAEWTFTATYRNFHLTSVTSTIVPTPADSPK